MPAYSIEPYSSELQGSSPGKMLVKKQSVPANNRQNYFLDSSRNIIGELRYSKFVERKKEWIIYRKFYLRNDKQIIGLIFGSALESKNDATLNSVILVKLEEDKVTNSYFYSYDKKFSEKNIFIIMAVLVELNKGCGWIHISSIFIPLRKLIHYVSLKTLN